MRVNICLVITILVIEVTFSMATRSVEAALEKQLNKKGYAVLQLKKKRLVLRNTDEKDGNLYNSNQHNENSDSQDRRVPADEALRKKYINRDDMESLARVNLTHRQRRHKNKGNSNDDGNTNDKEHDNNQEKIINDQLKPYSEDKKTESHAEESKSLSEHRSVKEDRTEVRASGKEAKSTDVHPLSKDVGTVFDKIAKAENYLLEKMEEIKSSLKKSITTLQKSKEMIVKRKRRDVAANKALTDVMNSLTKDDVAKLLARSKRENADGPSRACVFIDVPVSSNVPTQEYHPFHQAQFQTYNSNNWDSNSAHAEEEQSGQYENNEGGNDNWNEDSSSAEDQSQEYSNSDQQQSQSQSYSGNIGNHISIEDNNHEHFQSSISGMSNGAAEEQVSNHLSENGGQSMGESIDLHSIYWLKLPNEYNDSFDKKLYTLLSDISHSGRDILIIPVTRSFSNSDDITDGFLRAVRVTPNSQRAQYFKYDRQLNIQRIT